MTAADRVQVFDSQSDAYHHAFHVFLDHTDQKTSARQWLNRLVDGLSQHRVFIDVGAGTGQTTAWFAERFARTIAIEPSPSLNAELRRTCPNAEVLAAPIAAAQPAAQGDFILCGHVFYYIERSQWLDTLARMASWLAADGTLAVVLQNHETDCMKMLDAFLGRHFDLSALEREFKEQQDRHYIVERHLVPAHVTAPDFATACIVAEFMLNLLPITDPPPRARLEEYVEKHFRQPDGSYRFSCHQDFLTIRKR